MKEESNSEGLAFVRYKECVPSLDEVGEALKCLCVQLTTAGFLEERHDVEKEIEDKDSAAAGEWYGFISFQSFVRLLHFFWVGNAAYPFPAELHSVSQRIYNHTFLRESWMTKSKVQE